MYLSMYEVIIIIFAAKTFVLALVNLMIDIADRKDKRRRK